MSTVISLTLLSTIVVLLGFQSVPGLASISRDVYEDLLKRRSEVTKPLLSASHDNDNSSNKNEDNNSSSNNNKEGDNNDCWRDAVELVQRTCFGGPAETTARASLAMYNCFVDRFEPGRRVTCPEDRGIVTCDELLDRLAGDVDHRQLYGSFRDLRTAFCDHWLADEDEQRRYADLQRQTERGANSAQDAQTQSHVGVLDRLVSGVRQGVTAALAGVETAMTALATVVTSLTQSLRPVAALGRNVTALVLDLVTHCAAQLHTLVRYCVDDVAALTYSYAEAQLSDHLVTVVVQWMCDAVVRFAVPRWTNFPRIALTDVRRQCRGAPYNVSSNIVGDLAWLESLTACLGTLDGVRLYANLWRSTPPPPPNGPLLLALITAGGYLFESVIIRYALNNCPGAGVDYLAVDFMREHQVAARILTLCLVALVVSAECGWTLYVWWSRGRFRRRFPIDIKREIEREIERERETLGQ